MIPQPTIAFLIIEELARHGAVFAMAPGSRSTPLVLLMRAPALFHDERALGFFGVGLARTGALPVLTTTSGTAVANLLPAVVEASMDGLPMVILTADRAPEELGRGANQAIEQRGIFGSYVVGEYDIDLVNNAQDVLRTIDRAVDRAVHDRGPVHINVHFRKPLEETNDEIPDELTEWAESATPMQPVTRTEPPRFSTDDSFDAVVVGKTEIAQTIAAADYAQQHDLPIYFDIQSGMWGHGNLALSQLVFADPPSFDRILFVGNRLTEHRVWDVLASAETTQIYDWDRTFDPTGTVDRFVGELAAVSEAVDTTTIPERYDGPMNHRAIVSAVVTAQRRYDNVFIGNSLVIRAFDRFRPSGVELGATIFANRGASGIDGNLSTAAGIATTGKTLAVIGDHTTLHDIGALASLKSLGVSLRVLVIDNGGGRIFEHLPGLPKGVRDDLFVATPDISIAEAIRGFGIPVTEVDTLQTLEKALQEDPIGLDAVVCTIDPSHDHDLFRSTT